MEPGGSQRRLRFDPLAGQPVPGRLATLGIPLLFLLVGLTIYGVDYDHPDHLVWDEFHYVQFARHFANGVWMNAGWNEASEGDHRPWNYEHPPLGKYWMALAIKWGGNGEESRAYRLPGVLYAAAGLAGLSVLARRLFASQAAGILAPLLLLADPMWFVHARTAMLEIYVAAPMIWAFAFALGDRRWEEWAAAGAAGLGLAAKYTALFLLPVLFLVLLWRAVPGRSLPRAAGRALGFSLGVPWAVTFAASAPFLWEWWRLEGGLYPLTQWFFLLKEGFVWNSVAPGGPVDHPEHSPPLFWLPLVRPTLYAGQMIGPLTFVIFAIGNPLVWWGAVVAATAALVPPLLRFSASFRFGERFGASVRTRFDARDWRLLGSMGLAALIFLVGYLPHFAIDRFSFLYYMTLLVPYLALLAGGGLTLGLQGRPPWRYKPWDGFVQGARSVAQEPPSRSWRARWRRRSRIALGAALGGFFGRWGILLAVTLFAALAATLFAYWSPLFTWHPTIRSRIEEIWNLVPWMTNRLSS